MKRREFMALASWFIACPQLASGQSSERKRRIGLLSPFSEQDNETQARLAAFKQLLDKLGWTEYPDRSSVQRRQSGTHPRGSCGTHRTRS